MQIVYNQSLMDNEIVKILKKTKLRHAIIIVLFKEKRSLKYCVPMPRNPKKEIFKKFGI